MEHRHPGEVVVGVDASQASTRAARFAAEEAARRSVPLRIVHAVTWFDGMTSSPPDLDVTGLVADDARSLVEGMADSLAGLLPADLVRTSVLDGDPVEVLQQPSSAAVSHRRLGSTTHAVLHRAICPVAIVPLHAGTTR